MMGRIRNLFLYIFFLSSILSSSIFAQSRGSLDLTDDPIVAALDSLYKLDMFEMGYQKINYPSGSKFNYHPDSIPYSDANMYASRLAKLDAMSPFDLVYNDVVKAYIEMYAIRKRKIVSRMMALSQYYFPLFEEALDKYNLPLELKYLAICESALNPIAKSRAGAAGLWQFMYPTGKMFGLKVNSYVDERYDPIKSTHAACQYFQYLYGLYHDWQIVLAAYNCGPGNINRAIRKSGGKATYWEIRPYLPRETQGYVPAFIAVNYVMNFTAEHNIHTAVPKYYFSQIDTITVKRQLSYYQLSSILNISEDDLQFLNPSYRKRVIPVMSGYVSILAIPSDKIGLFVSNEDKIYNALSVTRSVSAVEAEAEPIEYIPQKISKTHVVKSGENLGAIAKKYKCTVSELKSWNNKKNNNLKAGEKLKIYTKQFKAVPTAKKTSVAAESKPVIPVATTTTSATPATEASTEEAATPTPASETGFKYHTIRRGDNLYKISQMYNTTIENIKRLNKLGYNYNLLPGQQIKVGTL
jgi:membrane-bound lytic murein transglycosylase D